MEEEKKQTISVRLNGKEQKVKERQVDSNSKDEIGAARDEIVDDAEIIPQPDNIIDFGKRQEERKRNDQPYWDDGFSEKSPKLPFKRKKKPSPYRNKPKFPVMLVVALFSAVVVGLSLGFMVLTVFTGNTGSIAETSETTGAIPTFSEPGENSLPVLTLEVVQGGAFGEQSTGLEIVEKIQEQGLAATLTQTTDPIYMFIGAGGDRAQATRIGSLYEGYGQDTYLKSYQVDGQAVTGQADEVTAWFTNAISHYKELLQLTVDGFGGGSLLTAERIGQLDQATASLQADRDQAFVNMDQSVQDHALALGDNLVLAGKKLAAYVDSKEEDELWKSQQALLDALVNYELVVEALR
ncbi:hypothetical protein N0O92_04685 [Alkalihalobacillus sp. MEB130]|uniref:hypothetical protein n=1 Tax=Alkalihalobacillus sp. MEB130 TaxID=2976704 RepID=UPI0028E08487|nr:hypothetical protein [Alkalihalobacillus sp. MEB130]MDT8859520.1 hypothetical protein [Alkalihalobacillus sp. MEB130]